MAVPAGRFERVYEAAWRGRKRLSPEVEAQLASLLEPRTLFTLAVLVGVWAGAQLTPVGPFADVALLYYSGFGVLKQLWHAGGEINSWVQGAIGAKSDEDLDLAGAHFARAISIIGVEALLTIIGLKAFQALKAKIRTEPARFGEPPARAAGDGPSPQKAPGEAPGRAGDVPAPPGEAPRPFRITPEPPPTPGPWRRAFVASMVALPAAQALPLPVPKLPSPAPFIVGGVLVVLGLGTAAYLGMRR